MPFITDPDGQLHVDLAWGFGMTTLLTGASGFVGSAVLRALLASGHGVRVLL